MIYQNHNKMGKLQKIILKNQTNFDRSQGRQLKVPSTLYILFYSIIPLFRHCMKNLTTSGFPNQWLIPTLTETMSKDYR